MPIKLIAMDMDGTLLGADHVTIPARNVAALRAAAERGVKLAIASGRTWSLIGDAADQLGGVDFALVANGASVRDVKGGGAVFEKAIPNARALSLIDLLHAWGLPFEVYCGGQNYVEKGDVGLVREHCLSPEFTAFFEKSTLFPDKLADALAGRDVEKFDIFHVPPERREEVTAAVRAIAPLEVCGSFAQNMELTTVGVNKGVALEAMAVHLGLTSDEVMAFGDAGNDLEMLSWTGWSFAMENGTDEAKAAARYLAPANTDAGIGQMVERYVLNME